MSELERKIRLAVKQGRVVFSLHADNRLLLRRIVRWQVVEGMHDGEVIMAYRDSKPNPKIVVRQTLADGMDIIAVWAYVDPLRCAKLVTVYEESK